MTRAQWVCLATESSAKLENSSHCGATRARLNMRRSTSVHTVKRISRAPIYCTGYFNKCKCTGHFNTNNTHPRWTGGQANLWKRQLTKAAASFSDESMSSKVTFTIQRISKPVLVKTVMQCYTENNIKTCIGKNSHLVLKLLFHFLINPCYPKSLLQYREYQSLYRWKQSCSVKWKLSMLPSLTF